MNTHPSYELFEELGQGDDTVVYRAYDISLGREVAIKELNEEARRDPRRLAQFVKEAQFLARYQHECVLQVHAADKERGWIIMELMQGTLASKLAQGSLAEDHVRSILRQVLEALDFLHAKKKVHGKVRPSNILINSEGQVKLSDFEESEVDGELPVPSGTRKYLAPELLKPEFGEFGPPLDLYCLGFTALELLAGPKFDSLFRNAGSAAIDADMAWLRWHSSEETLPPCREILPRVSADLAQALDGMLAKHASERPQTARQVLELLDDHPLVPIEAPAEPASSDKTSRRPKRAPTEIRELLPPEENTAAEPSKSRPEQKTTKTTLQARLKKTFRKPLVLVSLLILLGLCMLGIPRDSAEETPPEEPGVPTAAVQRVAFTFEPDVQGVTVWAGEQRLVPDEQGLYAFAIGSHALTFTKEGWQPHSDNYTVKQGTKGFTVPLSLLPAYLLVAVVGHDPKTNTTSPLPDASVVLERPGYDPVRLLPFSDPGLVDVDQGVFSAELTEAGGYTMKASASGFSRAVQLIGVAVGELVEHTVQLQKLPDTAFAVNVSRRSAGGEITAAAGAQVQLINPADESADEDVLLAQGTTNDAGHVRLIAGEAFSGSYRVSASVPGTSDYETATKTVRVAAHDTVPVDLELRDVVTSATAGTDSSERGEQKKKETNAATALPQEDAKRVAREAFFLEIVAYEVLIGQTEPADLSRPILGLRVHKATQGVSLVRVLPDTPAAKAGLQTGDCIEIVDGKKVLSPRDLIDQLEQARPGDRLRVAFRRDGRRQQTELPLGSKMASVRRLPRATVHVDKSDEPFASARRATTDAEGTVRLEIDDPGDYRVLIEKEGYEPAKAKQRVTRDGPNVVSVELKRKAKEPHEG